MIYIIHMGKINFFQNSMENLMFQNKHLLIQLNFLIKYMNFPKHIIFNPLSINVNNQNMHITIGVPTNNFLYVNVYKEEIIGKISRYFYSKYIISVNFIPMF